MKEYTIEDLRNLWHNCNTLPLILSSKEYPNYPEDYIFDENKSVKWNREEVQRHNNMLREKQQLLMDAHEKAEQLYHAASLEYIKQEVKCDDKVAAHIWAYVYERHHSYMNDFFDELEDIVELARLIAQHAI